MAENERQNAQRRIAYTVRENGDKSYWTRIGVAFTNRDGSVTVRLDALPVNGVIQIRDEQAREGGVR